VSRTARALATMVAGMLLVTVGAAGAGASLARKEISNEKYAKTLCTSIKGIQDEVSSTTDEYNTLDATDPAAFQTSAAALIDEVIAKVNAASKKMKKLSPEDGGKSITKLFTAYFKELNTKLVDAVTAFKAADPNGVAFQADVIQLETAFNILDVGVTDPFGEIDEQDLLGALGDEPKCESVVTIFGG
jgi:hypothetical protein